MTMLKPLLAALGLSLLMPALAQSPDVRVVTDLGLEVMNQLSVQTGECHQPASDLEAANKTRLSQMASAMSDPNAKLSDIGLVMSPLSLAIDADDVGLFRQMMASGAHPLTADQLGQMQESAAIFDTPAMLDAMMQRNLATDRTQTRPLIVYAALYARRDNVETLLRHGADINAVMTGSTPLTALGAAAMCGNQPLVDLLLDRGAKITPVAIRMAAEHGVTLPRQNR